MDKCTAIVLSAGKGTRMGTDVAKQYLPLGGRPVLYYCLKAFQDSFIDEIIIVAAREDHEYIRHEIVDKYGIGKVTRMVEGGAQRYDSVLCGLRAVGDPDFVFIHDGARPFINEEILKRAYDTVKKYGTAIVSVPSKDTVKIVDGDGITLDTPDRNTVWLMQTPQVFAYEPILKAYEKMDEQMNGAAGGKTPEDGNAATGGKTSEDGNAAAGKKPTITDDAMVMEMFGDLSVHVSEGSYRNIKITTPEDMLIAEAFI